MLFYNLLNYFSSISVTICVLITGYYIWEYICILFRKEKFSFSKWVDKIKIEIHSFVGKYANFFLIIALIATLSTNTAVHQLVGVHNLKLKPQGTYCFYVEAHRLGGSTYTLPAQVRIEKETEEIGDSKERTYTYYYIEKLFFTNGDVLDIEVWDSVEIDKTSFQTDIYNDEWELKLLNKHAYAPQVKETNNADWFDITFLLIEVTSITFLLFIMFRKEKCEE